MAKVIVEVSGGNVQAVYTDDLTNTEVMLIDRDNIEAGDEAPTSYDYPVEELTPDVKQELGI